MGVKEIDQLEDLWESKIGKLCVLKFVLSNLDIRSVDTNIIGFIVLRRMIG